VIQFFLTQIAKIKAAVSEINGKITNRFETVWENSSPNSSFSGQTVPLAISSARMIAVLFKYNTTAELYMSVLCPFSGVRDAKTFCNTNGSFNMISREVVWGASSVLFSDCYQHSSTGSSTVNNDMMIPVKILIVK
jgi:hypothetical protein